jgi:hypothetical protein
VVCAAADPAAAGPLRPENKLRIAAGGADDKKMAWFLTEDVGRYLAAAGGYLRSRPPGGKLGYQPAGDHVSLLFHPPGPGQP